MKDQKEKNGALFSSIISAAQRKVKRKTVKAGQTVVDGKEESGMKEFTYQAFNSNDLKETTNTENKTNNMIPTTVQEMEKPKTVEKVPWFNYSTDKEEFHRRVENFELETKAMLTMPRKSEISIAPSKYYSSSLVPFLITTVKVSSIDVQPSSTLSSSVTNMSHTNNNSSLLTMKSATLSVPHVLTKTHSASNVFSRTSSSGNVTFPLRNSLENPFSVSDRNGATELCQQSDNNNKLPNLSASFKNYNNTKCGDDNGGKDGGGVRNSNPMSFDRFMMRRGSSVENMNAVGTDINANGSLKKIRYENEVSLLI